MKCSNCDRPLVPGARFCGKCGTLAPQAASTPPKGRSISIDSDDEAMPSAPSVRHDDITPAKSGTTPATKPAKAPLLLEGPHPALLKARSQRDKRPSADDHLTDTPVRPESNPDLETLDDHPAAKKHESDTNQVRTDIPGPHYPFGQQMSDKNYFTAFLLSFFLGVFGADRFYTGQYAVAVIKLLTFGGLTVWSYIDALLLLANLRRDRFGRRLWGRNKDFRASLWIFVCFSIVGLAVFGFVMVSAINAVPDNLTAP